MTPISRPHTRRSPVFSLSVFGVGVFFVMISNPAPAKATRPVMKTENAIKNLKMSLPRSMDEVSKKDFLSIDLEPKAARDLVLKQANEYIEIRRGRKPTAQVNRWLERCEVKDSKNPQWQDNPFCAYEKERRNIAPRARARSTAKVDRRAVADDMKELRYDRLTDQPYSVIGGAIRVLENSGELTEVAKKIAGSRDCPPPIVPYAMGYKLEEQFPTVEMVDLADKLYRKGGQCGGDLYTAQSNFRLGLIQIWRNKCDEVDDLMAKVEASQEARHFHSRARYWRHHCATATENVALKAQARESLLRDSPMSFQTLAVVGNDDEAMAQVISTEAPSVILRSIVKPELNTLVRGSEALIRAGSEHLAAEMLDRSVGEISTLEPELRLYLAVLLNRIEHALPKFRILSTLFSEHPKMVTTQTMQLFFPLWYLKEVASNQDQVDPLLIISLIRQESAFNPRARSVVGARGLMQVMPATARTVVRRISIAKLYDPKTNIDIGSKYFLKRLGQLNGDVELTLAAYNAGFARIEQWKKRYPTDNKMLFLDFIPFRETREYVSAILRNYYWYVKLYSPELEKTAITNASVDAPKVNEAGMKVLAIMNANAGAAASLERPE